MGKNIVLTIAGSDSSAGAGIQADIKSIGACGGYAATAITAITAQNTTGVYGIELISDDMVRAQIDTVLNDLEVKAIKLGMIPTVGMVKHIEEVITKSGIKNIVLDPVMISTSGDMLVPTEVARLIVEKLMPLATVITPNIPECEFISGLKIEGVEMFEDVANHFKGVGCNSLLLKSGHLSSGDISDYLFNYNTDIRSIFRFKRIDTLNTHGTGCSLSSAIAAYLAQGESLESAVESAERYIHQAIATATYKMGGGHGAINHLFKLER